MTGGIPVTMPQGDYNVGLVLPDPAPTLYNRPEYAVRLANAQVWSGNGVNDLLRTLRVTNSATGTPYKDFNWFK